ncbi:MAG: alpha/beta hydrolase family protein [Candidatus Nanohaloarchaea archaeon]
MEKHFIEVENGEEVCAIHHGANSGKYLFICHGFGGTKQRQSEYMQPAADSGLNAAGIDFRGNGDSDGDFIEQDLSSRIKDLEAAIEHFDPDEVFLFGTSFGGRVVLEVASRREVDGVVAKAPVTYNRVMDKFREVVKEKGEFEYIEGKPIDQRFFDDLDEYSFPETASGIECLVAVFHGSEDTTVHTENSIQAIQELETDVMLQILEGEQHSFSEKGKQKLIRQMFSWLDMI